MAEEAGGAGNPGGGDAGGQPTPQPGAGGGQPGGSPSPTPGGNPGVGGQPGGGQPGKQQYSYEEDRSKWVHPDALRNRLREEQTKFQKQQQELTQQLEAERKRLQLAMGLNPKDPEEAQVEEVRAALLKVFPALGKLNEETLERVMAAAENGEVVQQTTKAFWDRHANTVLGQLKSEVENGTGLKLTERQTERLNREYTVFIQRSLAERRKAQESGDPSYDFNNDVLSRHNRGDQKLLEEFAKEFLDDWYEPVKKQATSAQARRLGRPVPSGGRVRQPLASGPPQIDYNNEDAFKKALLEARSGGQ